MSDPKDEQRTEPDDDLSFLDQVLNKLYDFDDGKRKSKKSRKRKSSSAIEDHNENNTVSHDTYQELQATNVSDSRECEKTASATQQSNVEVVTFVDPLKKNKLLKAVKPVQKAPDIQEKKKTDLDNTFEIERARFEVHQFGLSGYQKQQQRVFEQDRAIMLGARPPKRQYVNYKEYQQMNKEKRMKEKEEAKSDPQKKKRNGKKRVDKSKSSAGGQLGGQVGRFKNGMLVLSSKDIQKVNVKMKK